MTWTFAADTSTSMGSLALFKNNQLVDSTSWSSEKSHSEKITVEAQIILKKNNLAWSDIDQYAVSVGPGSFTGIRVALNFIRTLAYSYDKPVYEINSLLVLAAPALAQNRKVLCLQSAFRNLIYCASYELTQQKLDSTLEEILPVAAIEIEQLKDRLDGKIKSSTLVLGLGFSTFQQDFDTKLLSLFNRDPDLSDFPNAKNISILLNLKSPLVSKMSWSETKPLYIRASEAEEKLKNN
jgi:tRNA threonylcarbamoyladenosine biosynthesis protein TsaB